MINIDLNALDIYKKADLKLQPWEPANLHSLPKFEDLKILAFDIETTGLPIEKGQAQFLPEVCMKISDYTFAISKFIPNLHEYLQMLTGNDNEKVYEILDYYLTLDSAIQVHSQIKGFVKLLRIYRQWETLEIKSIGLSIGNDTLIIGVGDSIDEDYIKVSDEKELLETFINTLSNLDFDVLCGYNIFFFDLPFIINKCFLHNVNHPFHVSDRLKTFSTAQVYGSPTQYFDITLNRGKTAIIDLYHQVLAWDFVARKLTSRTLKQSVLQMGLRSEARLELTYEQMKECYESGDYTQLNQYLRYDLEDTLLLANTLIPNIYYQKLLLPDWKLHTLATAGNGSKWNDILKKYYGHEPTPQAITKYVGGYTKGLAGFHQHVIKGDIESMYPNIMLGYGITSIKDPDNYVLRVLRWLLTERIKNKQLAANGDQDAKFKSEAQKVMANSCYGFLGTSNINFNDYHSAALVTAYGRKIILTIADEITRLGGMAVEIDTDGIMMISKDFRSAEEIYNECLSVLPEGFKFKLELKARALWIPPKGVESDDEGLSKNYIVFHYDGTYKAVGKYRKRDRCQLEKEFQPIFLSKYLENPDSARHYYWELIDNIRSVKIPVDKIRISRKAKSNEKDVFERGLVNAEGVAEYYFGDEVKQLKKSSRIIQGKRNKGMYSVKYYEDLINQQFKEMEQYLT